MHYHIDKFSWDSKSRVYFIFNVAVKGFSQEMEEKKTRLKFKSRYEHISLSHIVN